MSHENILIGYTKWLAKWILIVTILCASAFGIFIFYENYQNELEAMISLKCTRTYDYEDALKDNSKKNKTDNKENVDVIEYIYFLLQKERDSELPSGVYRSAHTSDNITKETIVDDLVILHRFKKIDGDHYIFQDNNFLTKINRKNLQIDVMKDEKSLLIFECKLIDNSEFFLYSENKLQEKKSELKI